MPVQRRFGAGIRLRTTVAAVAIVGFVLLGASVAMVVFVTASVRAQVSDEAEIVAKQIADAGFTAGEQIPVGDPKEEFVQVVVDGQVVASSANASDMAPVAFDSGVLTDLGSVPFTTGSFAVFGVDMADGGSVVVGRNIDDVAEIRANVIGALFAGVPAIMAVVGLVTWWIVGRALRPVEDIRAEVERISAEDLQRRVPEPMGGDEIARLASTMNAMLERLQGAQERQRRFVSDASHELRSPVSSIRQHAEVAAAHPDGTAVSDLARVVLDEDARLGRLVDDLLLLAKMDEGRIVGRTTEVDLDDLVFAEAARVRSSGPLLVDTTGVGAARVSGNAEHLTRLVGNLCANAARHAVEVVALGLVVGEGGVVLTVEDDGPGIAPQDRERVFERFVRLDESRGRADGGSGLGLAIVYEVAAAHGGTVSLSESPLGGLRVQVRLPGVRPSDD